MNLFSGEKNNTGHYIVTVMSMTLRKLLLIFKNVFKHTSFSLFQKRMRLTALSTFPDTFG